MIEATIFKRLSKYQIKEDGCWGWAGATDDKGYGALSNRNGGKGSPEKAHRISFESSFGPIPDGLNVCHRCDNPPCTNPEHLFLGTQKDNIIDCSAKGRLNPKSLDNLNREKALNDKQVAEISALKFRAQNGRGRGVTVIDVAAQYNVCPDTIRKIKYNRY